MKKFTSKEIREMWLTFFQEHGHMIVESSSLIPKDDDSLLWINAGVTPLKKFFDGRMVPESRRLTNVQKCIRTNDIENVGVTKRHHTFFEMMGNFSIGDYFKEEAISMAYELLTSDKWFGIPKDLLYVTHYPTDTEARDKWIEMGLDPEHLVPLEDNFWEIGNGPCGPDSEIFFDRGKKYDKEGNALELFKAGEDQERYVEIWNNVFSQYNSEEGKDRSEYKELPSKNIDTGAGLERWACIFQDVDSNFDTDIFMPIMKQIEELSGIMYSGQMEFKVIGDHIRALTFALADGAIFENVGRGYILRRLLRRSVRMGHKLGIEGTFMYKLVDEVVNTYSYCYPYLLEQQGFVQAQIVQEEELFNKTLLQGEKRLLEIMDESLDNKISGQDAFTLYDTYGFPFELTLEILEEKGFSVDKGEFDKCMENQKKLSRINQKNTDSFAKQSETLLNYKNESKFNYDKIKLNSTILDIIKDDKIVDSIDKEGYIITEETPFYATSGGQVNDTGMIISDKFKARVIDVEKAPNGQHLHKVRILSGKASRGNNVTMVVDEDRRHEIEHNHSSVHLLQYALRSLISSDIHQAGSYVDEYRLRFDFNYTGKLFDDDLIKVENKVNELINEKIDRITEEKKVNEIDKSEVMALFSEKYGNVVRLVTMGESKELCGGTHVNNTGDIEKLAIINVENKGSNTYRIEAATGSRIEESLEEVASPYNEEIVKLIMKGKNIINSAKENGIELDLLLDVNQGKLESYSDLVELKNRVGYIAQEIKELEKKYNKLMSEKAISSMDEFRKNIEVINNVNLLLMETNNLQANSIKEIMDNLANEYENIFIFIANVNPDNSVNYYSRSNSDLSSGVIMKESLTITNGKGGGSNKFAQGMAIENYHTDKIFELIRERIKA